MHKRSATIRGRKYRLLRPRRMRDDGDCDPPDAPNKAIRIHGSLKGFELLEIVLHEALHACAWDLSEEAVEETARAQVELVKAFDFVEFPE